MKEITDGFALLLGSPSYIFKQTVYSAHARLIDPHTGDDGLMVSKECQHIIRSNEHTLIIFETGI